MDYYNIETEIGWCKCYEVNGIYYPVLEDDDRFLFEPILNIEIIRDEIPTD